MAGARAQRKPTFLWQAALILLPVVVLSAVGWFSVRQDKIITEHDARQRAKVIADEFLPKFSAQLRVADNTDWSTNHWFEVDEFGELVVPSPYAAMPIPCPFDLSRLSAEQLSPWRTMQGIGSNGSDIDDGSKACRQFLDTNPPDEFAASAHYQLGLLLTGQQHFSEAAENFATVCKEFPAAVTESGISLLPLAQLQLLHLSEHTPMATNLDNFVSVESFCSNVVSHPSLLTPRLLESAAARAERLHKSEVVQRWQRIWAEQELSRRLFEDARPYIVGTTDGGMPVLEVSQGRMTGTEYGTDDVVGAQRGLTSSRFWFKRPKSEAGAFALQNPRVPGPIYHLGWTTNIFAVDPASDPNWLAIRIDGTNRLNSRDTRFVCFSESELGACISKLLKDDKQIPDHFGIGVDVAGRRIRAFAPSLEIWQWVRHAGKEGSLNKEYWGGTASEVLASSSETMIFPGSTPSILEAERLRVSVYLTSPAQLYRFQTARSFWFGALVLASAIAALIGLIAAWRSFNRQQQLVELKSNFVSSVSHELRAPIASVRLMAENLEREKISEPQKQREYFAFIVQECRRLSSLIENVLDFSRIEQGRKQYDFEPSDLAALTRETVRLMEPYAAEKGVRLELANLLPGLPTTLATNPEHPLAPSLSPAGSGGEGVQRTGEGAVRGDVELNVDGRAIQQALVNLIDNAIKHSPKGETVRIGINCSTGVPPASGESIAAGTAVLISSKIMARAFRRRNTRRFSSGFIGSARSCAAKPRASASG